MAVDADDEAESRLLIKKRRCKVCDTAMDGYLIDAQRKLHVCGNNPDCSGFEVEAGEYRIKGYDGPLIQCDKCDADMHLKTGRFGKYFDCANAECKNTRKLLRSGEAAPPKWIQSLCQNWHATKWMTIIYCVMELQVYS